MMTENAKVGFVGGMDIPLIRDFFVGYEAGIKWVNPDVEVLDPVFVGGWADPTKGKELAQSVIDLGADALFVAAGKSGLGSIEAIRENDIFGFGVDACQDYLYPDIKMMASMTKRVDVAVFEMIKAAVMAEIFPDLTEGVFKGGIYERGVAEQWVGCCRLPEEEAFWETTFNFEHTPLPEEVVAKLTEARDKIVTGDIKVPRPPEFT
jgi:basic membrane protein A